MNRRDWVAFKSKAVYEAIRACWDEDDQRLRIWDENRITGDVLRAIGTSGSVQWGEDTCKASWKIFQAFGDFETLNGDIALNVVLSTHQGDVLVGVKHFEAKAANPATREYEAIERGQFARMAGFVGHEVLLYTLWAKFEEDWWIDYWHGGAGTLPTELALGLEREGAKALNASASSFVRVLSDALRGRGLDTDRQRVADFQTELNKVDTRYVNATAPIAPPPRPSFFMDVRVAIGEGPESRKAFDPPKAYIPLSDVASGQEKRSDDSGPAGP